MSLTITYTNESSEVKSQNSQGNISLILGYNGRPYDLHVINDNNLRIRIGNQEGYINDINIDTNTLDDDEKYRGAFTIPLSNSVIQQLPPGVYYLEVWINVSDQNNQTQQMIFPSDDTLPFTLTPNIVNDSNSLPMITFDRVRQAWEDFKNFIMGHQAQIEDDLATFDGVTDSFVGKVDDGISGYNNFVSQAGNKLNSLADSGKANIAAGVASADSNVSDINYRVDSAKTQISTAANGVYSVVDSDVNSAESAINSATASNKSETTSTVNSAENIINNAANGVVNGVNVTVDSAMTRIDNAADGIRGQVEGIVSSGDNRINNTAAGIESITSSAVSNASYVSTSLNSVANSAVTNVNYTVNSADNNMSNFASDINNRTSSADQHIDNDVSDAESNIDSTVASADSNMSNFASDINDRTSSADNHIDSDVTSADAHIDNDVASGDGHIDNTVSNADSHVDSNVLSGETRISNDVTTGESNINSVASAANTNTTNIAQNNTDTINSTATSAVSHVDSDVQSTDDHMNSLFNIDDAKTASAVSHIDSDATSVTNMAQTYSNNINSQANSAYTSINASGVNVYNGINNSGVSAYNAEDYSARSAYSNINNSASSAYINIDGYNGSASNAISGNTSSGISAINSAYGIASSAIQYAVDHSDKLIESDITNGVKSSVSNDFNKQAVSVQAQVEKTSNDVATINNNVTSLSNSTGSMAINVANQANEYADEKANSVLSEANHQTNNQAYDIQDQLNSVSDVTSNVATSAINRDNDLQNQINNHPNWNDENWTRNTVVPNAANSAKADANAHADQVATSAINQANANMEANRSSLSSRDDNMQAQISQNKNDISTKATDTLNQANTNMEVNRSNLQNQINDNKNNILFKGTIPSSDLNDLRNNGLYTFIDVALKNSPYSGQMYGDIKVINSDGNTPVQVIEAYGNDSYYRGASGSSWLEWKKIANSDDINNLQDQINNRPAWNVTNDLQNQINNRPTWTDENWGRNQAQQAATNALNQANANMEVNRSNLQNQIDNGLFKHELGETPDFNNCTQTGYYTVWSPDGAKNSPVQSNGTLIVFNRPNTETIIQKFYVGNSWSQNQVYIRQKGCLGDGSDWHPWIHLVDGDNLQNQINNNWNSIVNDRNYMQGQVDGVRNQLAYKGNLNKGTDLNNVTGIGIWSYTDYIPGHLPEFVSNPEYGYVTVYPSNSGTLVQTVYCLNGEILTRGYSWGTWFQWSSVSPITTSNEDDARNKSSKYPGTLFIYSD